MRLFELELAWGGAALGAIIPHVSALPHGIAPSDGRRFIGDVVANAGQEQAIALRVALWIVGLAPILVLRRFATFSSITAEERELVLARLLTCRLYAVRQLVLGLKAVASMLYARSAPARRAMLGVTPPPLESGFVALRTSREDDDDDDPTGARDSRAA
jgi:hypothetical protein